MADIITVKSGSYWFFIHAFWGAHQKRVFSATPAKK
jgi:hypothetical protein